MIVRSAVPTEHLAVLALYDRCGYEGGLADADEILVATGLGELLGVVRLCSENGVTVLRGMQVHPDQRRRRIGNALLDACVAALGTRTCFCLPYEHLLDFYGRVGFRRLEGDALPSFLQERLRHYRALGAPVVAMVRVP